MISHRLSHLYQMCDCMHFFANGQVIASGSREEVLFHHPDERIRKFVAKEIIQKENET